MSSAVLRSDSIGRSPHWPKLPERVPQALSGGVQGLGGVVSAQVEHQGSASGNHAKGSGHIHCSEESPRGGRGRWGKPSWDLPSSRFINLLFV